MIPVVTPEEMREIDANADTPLADLIARSGWVVADEARRYLGGTYGKRVAVFAGKGNNGADGRAAAAVLERWGVRCDVLSPHEQLSWVTSTDLVIDACYGTGFQGDFTPPVVGETPVLAIDIPSGVDGLTGQASGGVMKASRTVVLAALKPGNLFAGDACGRLIVRDIGLPIECGSRVHAEPDDLRRWPTRRPDHHKWMSAVRVVGGHRRGPGAPMLSSLAAARAGASYVQFSVTDDDDLLGPIESVACPASEATDSRIRCVVLGPGIPVGSESTDLVHDYLAAPGSHSIVLDAGGLSAIAGDPDRVRAVGPRVVMTPHDGEFKQLTGQLPGADRVEAAQMLAERYGCVVLLKGPATVVADPEGSVVISTAGDQRLATAGSGDVLAGVIGAGISQGLSCFDAAWLGTELVGRSLAGAQSVGVVASDLPDLVAGLLTDRLNRWSEQ